MNVEFDGKFTVSYETSKGECSAFRCDPELGRLIAAAPTLLALSKRIVFPNGGRDYTDAKEELATLVLSLSCDAGNAKAEPRL